MTFEEYILSKLQYSIVTYLYRTIHTRHSKEAKIKDPNFVVIFDASCIRDRGINSYAQLSMFVLICIFVYKHLYRTKWILFTFMSPTYGHSSW